MKTDSLFFALFQTTPSLLFELLGKPVAEAQGYQFDSVEVKQTAFRLDGVFLPPANRPDAPVYFLEVQFQKDPLLYRRLFSEVFLYLKQHPTVQQWQAVVIYPSPVVEVKDSDAFGELLQSSYVHVIYLNQLAAIAQLSPSLGILRLMVEPKDTVPEVARGLIERVQQSLLADTAAELIELIETIVVYTFPRCSRQEIAAMLGLVDMQETRVYQEGREEGREEEAKSLILRQLTRKLGELPEDVREQVGQLELEVLEELGEALFDFERMENLRVWLAQSQDRE